MIMAGYYSLTFLFIDVLLLLLLFVLFFIYFIYLFIYFTLLFTYFNFNFINSLDCIVEAKKKKLSMLLMFYNAPYYSSLDHYEVVK